MAIYKRPNSKYYWMKFTFDGELIQRSTQVSNKKDAKTIESALRTQIALGKIGIKPKRDVPTLRQACDDFLAMVTIEHPNKPQTIIRYTKNVNTYLRLFGNVKVDAITPEDIERFKIQRATLVSKKTKRLLKPYTVNHELLCLRMIFNRLVEFDVLAKSPAKKVKLLDVPKSAAKILTVEEQRCYLLACGQPLRDVAVLMVELGMRPSEVLNLKRDDVDLINGFLEIKEGKTKNAPRTLPLLKVSRKVLEHRLSNGGEKLFPNINNVHLGYFHQKALKMLGIEKFGKDYFTLYKLRHCFASRHTESQTDMITLSDLLGHGDLKTLKRYAQPSFEHKISAMERVEREMERRSKIASIA